LKGEIKKKLKKHNIILTKSVSRCGYNDLTIPFNILLIIIIIIIIIISLVFLCIINSNTYNRAICVPIVFLEILIFINFLKLESY
jgi:hypothetical protein